MKFRILFSLIFLTMGLFAQTTLVNPSRLLKPGGNSTFLITNGSGAVTWSNAATLLVGGAGITISGNTITNSSPDQTVSLTGATGITITGTYPNFTITPADASATNELQTVSAGDGSGSDRTITLSNSGGIITLAQGSGIGLSRSGNTITIAASASAPVVTIQRFEDVPSANTTTVTVSGFTPLTTDTMVFVDGVHMDWGSGEDITVAGSIITFSSAVLTGQKVIVKKITVN
jgi:hypothetical protein